MREKSEMKAVKIACQTPAKTMGSITMCMSSDTNRLSHVRRWILLKSKIHSAYKGLQKKDVRCVLLSVGTFDIDLYLGMIVDIAIARPCISGSRHLRVLVYMSAALKVDLPCHGIIKCLR